MGLTIARLDASVKVGNFDCGDSELNRYLHEDALENQERHSVGVTYVARDMEASEAILGYYTLAVGSVPKEPIRHIFGDAIPPYGVVPCILLGRLAVNESVKSHGIGSRLLRHAFSISLDVKASIGCRLMIVDAYANAIAFYEKFGFMDLPNPKQKRSTTRMFIDLVTVENAQA